MSEARGGSLGELPVDDGAGRDEERVQREIAAEIMAWAHESGFTLDQVEDLVARLERGGIPNLPQPHHLEEMSAPRDL